jgi:hypothetical protein
VRHLVAPTLPTLPRAGSHGRLWALALVIALAGHAWLLADAADDARARRAWPPAQATPMSAVRRFDLPARPAVAPHEPTRRVALTARAAEPAPRPAEPGRTPLRESLRDSLHDPARAAALARPQPLPGVPTVESAAVPPPAGDTMPATYRTRIPPPFVLVYDLQRGAASGRGELRFEPGAETYALTFETRVPGREALGLASRGRVDAHGLAPERFADLRRGRERQAANFDRAAARITYSGPPVEHELLPGAQDRLSWMVQLPAIVDADPAAFGAGARVQVQVSGARGDAAVWTFVVQGLATSDGTPAPWLHLVREPARPYDTRAEVWLDPARHHLPVRLRLSNPPAGEGLELRTSAAAATATP